MKTFRIITYGCQMNERDSETLAGILQNSGYEPADPGQDPDVLVFNTCCVRENAERRLFGTVEQYKDLKKRKPGAVIAIVGCLSQQPGAAERIRKKLPHVDVVLGTHNIHRIADAVECASKENKALVEVWENEEGIIESLPVARAPGVRAWVTIMYGCNNFCSYCIVPYVRGRERSREPDDIIREVRDLVSKGYKEVVLLGQNVNTYGKTLGRAYDFADLLTDVNAVEGLLRIRYMTSHPRDFTQKIIDAATSLPKVCEHFHLPVQAGSNAVLERMNRGYTREQYFDLVERIRARAPSCSITTDLIVGFPGETDRDFELTLDLVRKVEFDAAFTFIFSPRSGTRAQQMPDQVPEPVKKERLSRLIEVQSAITQKKNRAMVGQVVEVLVEGPSETDPTKTTGRTRTDKTVNFISEGAPVGSLVKVEITGSGTWTLRGKQVG